MSDHLLNLAFGVLVFIAVAAWLVRKRQVVQGLPLFHVREDKPNQVMVDKEMISYPKPSIDSVDLAAAAPAPAAVL